MKQLLTALYFSGAQVLVEVVPRLRPRIESIHSNSR
jgi:hypothetical protein